MEKGKDKVKYLEIEFADKDKVKELGARFDFDKKGHINYGAICKYDRYRENLYIHYDDIEDAKRRGYLWDNVNKTWYRLLNFDTRMKIAHI